MAKSVLYPEVRIKELSNSGKLVLGFALQMDVPQNAKAEVLA